jgi:hypothetical protein
MTKIDGHKHYDQKIGHEQFGQATSDPTWLILRGMVVIQIQPSPVLLFDMGQAQ